MRSFKGQVYFSKQFSLVDVHDYYENKGIYTVEQVNDNTLFVDSKDGYSFSVQLTNYNDYVLFSLTRVARKNLWRYLVQQSPHSRFVAVCGRKKHRLT